MNRGISLVVIEKDKYCSHSELVSESLIYNMKQGFVYIMSNKNRTVLYIGVTNNLERRVLEHKTAHGSQFTSKYKLFYLLYFEKINGIKNAIQREKQLKNWHSQWKWNLIKEKNPTLIDLAKYWFTEQELIE